MSRLSRFLPRGVTHWLKILLRPKSVAVLPGKISYADDGFATIHSASFGLEPRFASAYQSGLQTGSWSNVEWRAHVIAWAAQYAVTLNGDFVECGVNRGGYSKMIVDYLNFSKLDKKFYLLDTFSGLVPDYVSDDEKQRGILDAYHYEDCFRAVTETFANTPNVVLVRGPVPDTLPQVRAKAIAFLSIDMNCIEPEIAAANVLWDRIVPGGILVLDDYGHPLHVGQKDAFDRFAREKKVTILSLPTAQAIIVKPH